MPLLIELTIVLTTAEMLEGREQRLVFGRGRSIFLSPASRDLCFLTEFRFYTLHLGTDSLSYRAQVNCQVAISQSENESTFLIFCDIETSDISRRS